MSAVASLDETAEDLAADQEARIRAVDPDRSVILQAPAGSGKTTVLIERLLVLLARAQEPEEILAITFTRKAAAEMALRVAQVLLPEPDPSGLEARAQRLHALAQAVRERSQARGWRLTENPGRLRIQTLDALNRALALQMPLAARGSGSLGVLPQPGSAYRTAARRTLLDAQSDPSLRADVQVLFERMENDFGRCEALIAGMLARRTHWLPYLAGDAAVHLAARVTRSLEAVVEARLARARQLVPAALLQAGLTIGSETARHLQSRNATPGPWSEFLAADSLMSPSLRQWQALAAMALTQTGTWRKRLDVRAGFPPEDLQLKRRCTEWLAELAAQRGSLELFNEIQLLPDPQISADETQVLGVLARLLRLAVAELDLVFTEMGRVDYPAIAAAARTALGSVDDPTDLALRLDNRIQHILVDEFQDTSLEQTRLLALLTAGWMPEDGRTLFLVGDPMQSIYGFREAEVGMFLGARTAGIGTVPLEPLSLRRNFRSTAQLVEWNNRVFAQCFPETDDPRTSSVAYSRSVAARTAGVPGAVHLHRVLPGDAVGEAHSIARIVAQLRAAQADSSIAILVSARAHAGPIVAALEARQIAVAGVDLVSLAQLSIVRDLMALTQGLDHLGDRTAWLAMLRAPWCGLTLREISQLVGTGRSTTVWQRVCDPQVIAALAPDTQARLQRLRATLAPVLEYTRHEHLSGHESLARRVETAWLRLGGPAACAHEADLIHARAYLSALALWSQEPDWTGPQELPRRLDRLFAAHAAGAGQAVQIMTIHHAKGLEFDHVILPGLGRTRRRSERPLLQWLDLPHGTSGSDLLMVAVPPAAAAGPTPLGRYVTRLQEQRERNEATRLLYVAATRARLQLHLFGQLEDSTEAKPDPAPRAGTLLERLWPAIKDQFPPQAEGAAAIAPAQTAPLPILTPGPLERLSAAWQLPQLPQAPQSVTLPMASYEAASSDAAPSGWPLPQAAGDLVERAVCEVLRSLARRRRHLRGDAAMLLAQLLTRLQRLGCPEQTAAPCAAEGLQMLRACLDDARLQWIFTSLSAADAQAEVPLALTGMFAGRLTSIRADLSFLDPGGTRWLIDIAPQPLTELETAFGLRLSRHVQLAQALDDAPARAAVYLPGSQLFWAPPPSSSEGS
jgi:ATP-dependent exoDNAse (exonuclease V) beta subunit